MICGIFTLLVYIINEQNCKNGKFYSQNKGKEVFNEQANCGSLHNEHFFGKSEDAVEEVHGLASQFHHHIGIDFRAVDIGVSQEAACGVEVTASGEGHRGECVTRAVKADVLVDACSLCHVFQSTIGATESRGIGEHFCISLAVDWTFGHPFQGFIAQWYNNRLLGFLHGGNMQHESVVSFLDVTPF